MSDKMYNTALARIQAFVNRCNALRDSSDDSFKVSIRSDIKKDMQYFTALQRTNPAFFNRIINQYKENPQF